MNGTLKSRTEKGVSGQRYLEVKRSVDCRVGPCSSWLSADVIKLYAILWWDQALHLEVDEGFLYRKDTH
jgi:hypothetical protein